MARILSEESSLTRKRQSILRETRLLTVLLRWELFLAAILTVLGFVWWLWRGTVALLTAGAVALIVWGAHALRIGQNRREEHILQAGLRGESEVSRTLNAALDESHYLFNDLHIRCGRFRAQIDHLVVCPKGLFVIETKNWRGHVTGDDRSPFWEQVKTPGTAPIRVRNPLLQIQRQMACLCAVLEKEQIDAPDIHPLVVFMSPLTTFELHTAEVPVLFPETAADNIQSCTPTRKCTEAEIDGMVRVLMKFSA